FIFLNMSSTCHLARYIYSTSAVDQVPVSSVVMSSSHPATASVGVVSVRPAFWALRRARHLARRVAVGSTLAATSRTRYRSPPPPLPLSPPPGAPPGRPMAGAALPRFPGEGGPEGPPRLRPPAGAPPWPHCGDSHSHGRPR